MSSSPSFPDRHPAATLNGAMSQADRLAMAPKPALVPADGRTAAQLAAFAGYYGGLLNFFNLGAQPDGDWTAFFASDPAIGLAMLVSLRAAELEVWLRPRLEECRRRPEALTPAALGEMLYRVRLAIQAFDHAHRAAAPLRSNLARTLRAEIADDLAPRLRAVEVALGRDADHADWRPRNPLSQDWRHAPSGNKAALQGERMLLALAALVEGLTDSLARLLEEIAPALDAALEVGDHAPQAALWLAFAKVFRHAQASMNQFAGRLLDFYHADILHQVVRDGEPGSAILCFTPQPGQSVAVPVGTKMPAGQDADQQPVIYQTTRSLQALPVQLAGLRTLLVSNDPQPDGQAAWRTTGGTVALDQGKPADPSPLFGDAQAGVNGAMVSQPASQGFLVAGPVLLLIGGSRSVTLTLGLLAAAGSVLPADPAALIEASFDFFRSSAKGWVPITDATIAMEDAGDVQIDFTLDPDESALEPLPSAPAADGSGAADALSPDQPAILARLRTTCPDYPALQGLRLGGLTIAVSVSGLTDFTLASSMGALTGKGPFALFGSPPTLDAWFSLSDSEIFSKSLDSLSLGLGWYGLPQGDSGFNGWYRGYTVNQNGENVDPGSLFNNQSFTVDITTPDPGWWILSGGQGRYLFRTVPDDDAGDAGGTGDSADPADVPEADAHLWPESQFSGFGFAPATPPDGWRSADASLRITLKSPAYAFGDTLYPPSVVAASQKLMPLDAACSESCARSCAPWAEVAKASVLLTVLEKANSGDGDSEAVDAAGEQTQSDLSALALRFVDTALATLAPDRAGALRLGLDSDMRKAAKSGQGWLGRLQKTGDGAATRVSAALRGWIAKNKDSLDDDPAAAADMERAGFLMEVAAKIADAVKTALTSDNGPVARIQLAAKLAEQGQRLTASHSEKLARCIDNCEQAAPISLWPNQPWLPTITLPALNYTAGASLPLEGEEPPLAFSLLQPLGGVQPVDWGAGQVVPLLFPVEQQAAQYLDIGGLPAAGVPGLSLLYVLQGGTADLLADPPPVRWSWQTADGGWQDFTSPDGVLEDGTDGLTRTGIITLAVGAAAVDATGRARLRAAVDREGADYPTLAGLFTNPVPAIWTGPGGADRLDMPLPAGSITQPLENLPGLSSVQQPLPGVPGRPLARGLSFQAWMAERLSHKDRAIRDMDWPRLVLAQFPSLWQVAVRGPADSPLVPPGQVRLYLVAGRQGDSGTDASTPIVSSETISQVQTFLAPRISPFIRLSVTNPPWCRITVSAQVYYRDVDTATGLSDRLSQELTRFLSPWPCPDLGRRPAQYWRESAIAEFILGRSYVLGLDRIDLTWQADGEGPFLYFTSADQHAITGTLRPSCAMAGGVS